MAQMVERVLGKDEVTGSIPVSSSKKERSNRFVLFLSKPIGLVYHHDVVVYIIKGGTSPLYLITPLGVHKKLSA